MILIDFSESDLLIATVDHSVKMPIVAKDANFETIRECCLPELELISLFLV